MSASPERAPPSNKRPPPFEKPKLNERPGLNELTQVNTERVFSDVNFQLFMKKT